MEIDALCIVTSGGALGVSGEAAEAFLTFPPQEGEELGGVPSTTHHIENRSPNPALSVQLGGMHNGQPLRRGFHEGQARIAPKRNRRSPIRLHSICFTSGHFVTKWTSIELVYVAGHQSCPVDGRPYRLATTTKPHGIASQSPNVPISETNL